MCPNLRKSQRIKFFPLISWLEFLHSNLMTYLTVRNFLEHFFLYKQLGFFFFSWIGIVSRFNWNSRILRFDGLKEQRLVWPAFFITLRLELLGMKPET